MRFGPRTLIKRIKKNLEIWSKDFDCSHFAATTSPFPLSVKCTLKKSDLFRIWRSPLEIGFTRQLTTHTFNFARHLLWNWYSVKKVKTLNLNRRLKEVNDDRSQISLWHKPRQGNPKDYLVSRKARKVIQCCKVALIGSRSICCNLEEGWQEDGGGRRVQRSTLPAAQPTISLENLKRIRPIFTQISSHQEFLNILNNLKSRKNVYNLNIYQCPQQFFNLFLCKTALMLRAKEFTCSPF